ncbi:hypothetical protein AVEN_146991-1 [Araneus ventricosus]|uniref:Uncharacterized protein n=1 Tax=Araneus ventricosus TaxID=182803 RepID=A0A4Y2AVE5_ARAVE|nr:hypothetical protein AVEN_70496-1 [Araneus ventricosus]GBL83575.1 hypothetical protein AVEN_146991-1 [Araneus ventricosus]
MKIGRLFFRSLFKEKTIASATVHEKTSLIPILSKKTCHKYVMIVKPSTGKGEHRNLRDSKSHDSRTKKLSSPSWRKATATNHSIPRRFGKMRSCETEPFEAVGDPTWHISSDENRGNPGLFPRPPPHNRQSQLAGKQSPIQWKAKQTNH